MRKRIRSSEAALLYDYYKNRYYCKESRFSRFPSSHSGETQDEFSLGRRETSTRAKKTLAVGTRGGATLRLKRSRMRNNSPVGPPPPYITEIITILNIIATSRR